MHRVAVFVDAGHYFANAARLAFDERVGRRELVCEHAALVDTLIKHVHDEARMGDEPVRVLRVYWYDGAPNAVPSSTQLEIGRLSSVKLRMGRLSGKQQKGVDGLIILDLITLARERAIDTAFLLSGDEDLREAVAAAQQFGVRVVLLGIPPIPGQGNQAESLIREADHHQVLPPEFWTTYLTRTGRLTESIIDNANSDAPAPHTVEEPHEKHVAENVAIDARAIAAGFVEEWLTTADPDDVVRVADARPRIPGALDAALLECAWEANGRTSLASPIRKQLRQGFWRAFTEKNQNIEGETMSTTEVAE
jgi:uncharacterized LabA/DUF88 family protein